MDKGDGAVGIAAVGAGFPWPVGRMSDGSATLRPPRNSSLLAGSASARRRVIRLPWSRSLAAVESERLRLVQELLYMEVIFGATLWGCRYVL